VPGTVAAARRAAGGRAAGEGDDLHGEDHWYRLDAELPPGSRLAFAGLATLAEVWLDGRLAAQGSSMFMPLDVEVPRQGARRLELCFRALRPHLAGRGGGRAPRWRGRLATSEALRRHRTTLLGHMPGWSPPVGVVGPYRPVVLHREPPSGPAVRRAALRASLREDGAGVVELRLAGRDLGRLGGALDAAGHGTAALRQDGDDGLHGTLLLRDPPLWWPHTHGEPRTVAVEAEVGGRRLDLGHVGFRRLARRPHGEGFGLLVNGAPVFCRGAIWAGLDPADLPATREALLPALRRARDAGLNMLRVPGFTLYESPEFYALCDELGLLVWQDFMFARFDYPGDAEFLAAVRAEARAFLGAVQAHPSLAVLCGGAEVAQAAAMAGRPPGDWSGPLFEEVLAGEAAALRPDVPYLPHAPLGGGEAGGGLPFAAAAPVAHYFGVGGYLRPPEDLLSAGVRFAAECLAFSNPPDPAACRALGAVPGADPRWRAGVPRDLGAGWDFEDVRDHYLETLFHLSPAALRRADPESWLAHGRAAVALLIEQALGTWRTDGRCAGALVLMLQDLVPGAGWGVVGHDGRPKSGWHALRRICRPVQVVLRDLGQNGVVLHAINETPHPRSLRLGLRGLAPDGGVEALGETLLDLPARGAQAVPATALTAGRWRDLGHAWRFGPPGFAVLGATLDDAETGARLSEATHFPLGPALPRTDPGLGATLLRQADGQGWRLAVSARGFAQFVQLDDEHFTAEEDHFHLWPGEVRELALLPAGSGGGDGHAPHGTLAALNGHAGVHYRGAA
jgi:beta-mannosidase